MGDLLQTVSSVSPGYNKLVNGTLPLKHTSEQTARCCPCREHPHEQSILFLQLDAAPIIYLWHMPSCANLKSYKRKVAWDPFCPVQIKQ